MWKQLGSTFILSLVFFCCKKDGAQSLHSAGNPIIGLSLSTDTVYSGINKEIAIVVSFTNIQQLKSLIIRKGTSVMKDFESIPAQEVKGTYTFKYTVTSDDNFSFSALGLDNKEYGATLLTIDNRTGLLPLSLTMVARVTGKTLSTGVTYTNVNPNNTDSRFDVGCTDLGIMWAMGDGRVGVFFGDTQGKDFAPSSSGGGNGANWRSNVLGFVINTDLSGGLVFSSMATEASNPSEARQIIHSDHITNGTGSFTAIPTAAIHANGEDYVHYMDVRQWGEAGKWTTNFSALYKSTDNGQNWTSCSEVKFSATSNFSQICYAKKDGYVYMIGTISGRFGSAFLARFLEADILNQSNYEYYNNVSGWLKGDESKATAIFDAPVSELSLTYNTKFGRWIAVYLDVNKNAIILRDAKVIEGNWSAENVLVSSTANNNYYGGLYGGFIYPLKSDSEDLYYTMSLWFPYNVFLMKSSLKLVE